MQETLPANADIITIKRSDLYELVKMAVYDALSGFDFLMSDEQDARAKAFRELEDGDAVSWEDYLKEREVSH